MAAKQLNKHLSKSWPNPEAGKQKQKNSLMMFNLSERCSKRFLFASNPDVVLNYQSFSVPPSSLIHSLYSF